MTLRDLRREQLIKDSQKVLILDSPYIMDGELYLLHDGKFSQIDSDIEDAEVIYIYTEKDRKNTLIIEVDKIHD